MSINIKNDISIFLGSNKVNIKPFNLFDELIINFFHEISNEIKKKKKIYIQIYQHFKFLVKKIKFNK